MRCLIHLRQCRDEKRNIAVRSESVDCVRNIAIQVEIWKKNPVSGRTGEAVSMGRAPDLAGCGSGNDTKCRDFFRCNG